MVPKSLKKIYYNLPRPIKRVVLRTYEDYYRAKTRRTLGLARNSGAPRQKNPKPRVLFYYLGALSYGGVAKMIQEYAKHLNFDKYEVYIMYSAKPMAMAGNNPREDSRKFYVENTPIHLIEHDYERLDGKYPYIIWGMKPSMEEVIKQHNIDVLVTTGSGYTEFPFILVTDIPILHFNLFASPAVQKNIRYHIAVSHDVADHIKRVNYPEEVRVMYIPTQGPPPEAGVWAKNLREKLGLKDSDLVFGRIGRAVDGIFDPIGIRAFQKIVGKYPHIHYLIMSPPPILRKIVAEDKIPNVHLLPSSGLDEDIWGFHMAIDVLAHFRHDGESLGLNLAESMYCRKPIISHKSHFWNSHLEYLEPSFSFIADVDNVDQYAQYMEMFAKMEGKTKIHEMGELAYKKVDATFNIRHYISDFEGLIDSALLYKNN